MPMKEGEVTMSLTAFNKEAVSFHQPNCPECFRLQLDWLICEEKRKCLFYFFRLRCGHHYADRDIVQFVPFREFKTVSLIFCSVKSVL